MSVFPLLLVIVSVLSVSGDKKGTDYLYKASAQICKPYFEHCRGNPVNEISACFKKVYNQCLPGFRKWMQSIETCVDEAGDDFESVKNCYMAPK